MIKKTKFNILKFNRLKIVNERNCKIQRFFSFKNILEGNL